MMQLQQHAEEQSLLGPLCPGQKKLLGKTFYLDSVKKRPTAILLETISLLGGGVESFLHKDVSFVVTGNQECLKKQKTADTKTPVKGTSGETQPSIMTREKRPGTPRPMPCGSRGKALLEKAIRNNEQLQKSSVLANAQSWGVKILYVDDVLLYLKRLTRESFSPTHKRPEKTYTKQQSHVVKAAPLRSPYLKIEDSSRKYKPLHMQSMTFPSLWYLGRYSPFESPPPPQFEKHTEQVENKTRKKKKIESSPQDKAETPPSFNPSPWRPRKKDTSYCECCHQSFSNLEEHLQSDQHRAFVLDPSNYSAVDQLVAEMLPGFDPDPPEQSEKIQPSPLSIQDVFEFEPLDDAETEHAVQALQRQGLSLGAHFSSRCGSPVAPGLGSPSTEVLFPLANPATLPPDIQPLTPDTYCQRPESPTMPVLDAEPQAHDAAGLPSDAQRVPPCPDRLSPLPEPYSLPPVLSPQVPYPCENMELHSSYSDPPVLSPQQYAGEEPVEGHTCEAGGAELVFESVAAVTPPTFTPFLSPVALTTAEEVKGSSLGSLADLSRDSLCSTKELKFSTLFSRRSRSLPRQSATAHNPRKRCRSASPQHSWSKRRRIAAKAGGGDGGNESVKPLSDIMAKQTLSMFCLPALQNLSRAGNQSDTSGHGCASLYNQPSCPLSLKDKNFDPPHLLPCDKSQRAFSSQDSQLSLSHSTSLCIEPALIPDLAGLSSSSSDSDWDCGLLSRLGPALAAPPPPAEPGCELDKELLHRPCTWMHDSSYESRLHSALQSQTAGTSLCGDEMDSSAFSRTLVKIVEVKH